MKTNATTRKLYSWELQHLRALVAEQQAQIERLEDDLIAAERMEEFWREEAMPTFADSPNLPRVLGMSCDGEVAVFSRAA